MITLRPYQNDIIVGTRAALARSKSALIVLQTGGGKTAIASFIAKNASEKGKTVMFACHRDFLIEQTSKTFSDFDIPHTFICSGEKYHKQVPVCIASMDTLKNRIGRYDAPDILIVDEAIHAAAKGWDNAISKFQSEGSMSIGLAACPQRNDGKGLRPWFKEMVIGPSMRELIEMGYLSDYKIYAPSGIDRSKLHVSMGEFKKDEAEEVMSKPQITGCAVNEYKKFALGRQGVSFCVSIKHSHTVAQSFRDEGIVATHIGSDTATDDRKEMLKDFKLGKIKMLTSVDIFSEGFDLPVVEYAALLRPTKSLNTYRQQIGRALRKADGKDFARIADHSSNYVEHGFPDEHIEWTLNDRERRGKSKLSDEKYIKAKVCPKCFYAHKPALSCVQCGHVYEVQSRKIEEVEGELQEIQRQQEKKVARMEVGRAQTIDDLWAIAKERGYKSGWVHKQASLKGIYK